MSKDSFQVSPSPTRIYTELEEVSAEWRALAPADAATPFESLDWASAWLQSASGQSTIRIVTVGSPIEALLPLQLHRSNGLRCLQLLGHGVSDYLGPVPASTGELALRAISAALASLSREYDILDLRGLHCSSEQISWLAGGLGGTPICRLYERCPVIRTNLSWDAFLVSRTKKFRANLKRTLRRTKALGAVSVGIESATSELFDEMIDVERQSWKWQGGFAYLRNERNRDFLRRILLKSNLDCEIWACRIDGLLASFALLFRSKNVRYYYLPSFRAEYSDTGTYLLSQIVRDSCDTGISEVDLLQGDERYKMIWADSSREVHQLVAPGRGVRASTAMAGYRLRWRLAESERLHAWRQRYLLGLQRLKRLR